MKLIRLEYLDNNHFRVNGNRLQVNSAVFPPLIVNHWIDTLNGANSYASHIARYNKLVAEKISTAQGETWVDCRRLLMSGIVNELISNPTKLSQLAEALKPLIREE